MENLRHGVTVTAGSENGSGAACAESKPGLLPADTNLAWQAEGATEWLGIEAQSEAAFVDFEAHASHANGGLTDNPDGLAAAAFHAPAPNEEDGLESDECVLERLRSGEQGAMDALWSRYAGLLYSLALRVLHNPTEAEDIVVEVFSEVWRRADRYHPERARPVAWLVTLVRRRAIDRFRERRSYEKAGERLARENSSDGLAPPDGTEEQLRLADLRRLLEQALLRLPEAQRRAVCMAYFEGLTQREISERTGTPVGTVKTRLELGLRKMRERLRSCRGSPEAVAAH